MYQFLSRQLYSVADGAKRFYRERWGIADGKIQVEEPIQAEIKFGPTLHAVARDFYWLCVEVSERAYPDALDAFVLECKNQALPVKLYVATPPNDSSSFRADLVRAKKNGVGLLEVADAGTNILREAVPLSLTGLRVPNFKEFPAKYRQAISNAVETFLGGNPLKGCSDLYEELEALTNRIALKALKSGHWKGTPPGASFNPGAVPWARVTKLLMNNFDPAGSRCPELKEALFARVLGVTPHRNEAAHKPKSQKELKKRDSELRTRFESVSDLLLDLIRASKAFRV